MADSTITTIRKALANQIQSGVARSVNVSWYPQSGMSVPLIEIVEDFGESIDYTKAFGSSGEVTLRFTLVVLIDGRNAETITMTMDDLLSWDSSSSIFAAVAEDRTLGGLVEEALVLTASRIQGDPTRAELPVEINLPKS